MQEPREVFPFTLSHRENNQADFRPVAVKAQHPSQGTPLVSTATVDAELASEPESDPDQAVSGVGGGPENQPEDVQPVPETPESDLIDALKAAGSSFPSDDDIPSLE